MVGRCESISSPRGDDTNSRISRVDLLLAASAGGHLGRALELKSQIPFRSMLVTTDSGRVFVPADDTAFLPSPRGLGGWMRSAIASLLLTLRVRPSLVVALGSGGVVFFCLWSRLFGSLLTLLESFARVHAVSRLLRFLSSMAYQVLAQWPDIQAASPGSVLVHPIYEPRRPMLSSLRKVFVSVGRHWKGMDRLLRIVDEAYPLPGNPSMTFQVGNSTYRLRNSAWARWAVPDKFAAMLNIVDLIITHDGANTIAQSLQAGKPVIVVPRKSDELDYPSRRKSAVKLERRGLVLVANNSEDLRHSIDSTNTLSPNELSLGDSSVDRIVAQYLAVGHRRISVTAARKDAS